MVFGGAKPRKPFKFKKQLRYFFLDDDVLYKVLKIQKPQDIMIAWCYPERRRVTFVYSDILRRHKRAWTMSEVCAMVERASEKVNQAILDGAFPPPHRTYSLDGQFKPGKYMWSEKDIFRLHDYLLSVHKGRPRADGKITVMSRTPSRAQIRARMENETAIYVKNDDGEFVRVWKEAKW